MPRLTFTNLAGRDIAVGNGPLGVGQSFTIPVAGLTKDLSGAALEDLAPQLDALRTAGSVTWVSAQNPNVSDDLEVLSGAGSAMVLPVITNPAAKSATAVHASLAGNAAANLFPGPITNPTVPRNLSAVAAASYDGGSITVVGTDQFDKPVTETIVAVANSTVYGTKIFKTVTSITKGAVGANAAGVSIGTGDKLGIAHKLAGGGIQWLGATLGAATLDIPTIDTTYSAMTPGTIPTGSISYWPILNVVR